MTKTASRIELSAKTLEAFNAYVRTAEAEMGDAKTQSRSFLWSDLNADRIGDVRRGKILAQFWSGRRPTDVPDGLIHDWIAAAFMPESTIQDLLAVCRTITTTRTSTNLK